MKMNWLDRRDWNNWKFVTIHVSSISCSNGIFVNVSLHISILLKITIRLDWEMERRKLKNWFYWKFLRRFFFCFRIRWTYHTADELHDMFLYGNLHIYAGGGFYFDMLPDASQTASYLKELEENDWITRGTRLVLLEFSLYNVNERIFCIIKWDNDMKQKLYRLTFFKQLF